MPNERENFYQPLTSKDFEIAGVMFRAFYDADDKLVFVMDLTTDDVKPNVLLVINPIGNRKWDDILMNDFGVDLETVRPKKDNKYQKLDIEYAGLADYDAVISAVQSGENTDVAVAKLMRFRAEAAQRAAYERLAAAELTAEKARETIEKSTDSVAELQDKLKKLKAKLAEYRRNVGKEPTKQSAAKILKTESQIDATNDKLVRAKKRLDNAKTRLTAAEDDKEQAIYILRLLDDKDSEYTDDEQVADVPMVAPEFKVMQSQPENGDVMVVEPAPVPATLHSTDNDTNIEAKATEMADEEVKPLFDKNPNILDEEIAFKPIDFDVPVNKTEPVEPVAEPVHDVAPLSFTPPVAVRPVVDGIEVDDVFSPDSAEPVGGSMLDSLTPVALPSEQIDSELLSTVQSTPDFVPEPVMPHPVAAADVPSVNPQPMPEIAPAPVDSGFRPVSPITGMSTSETVVASRKPTMLYYVMLVVLIALSIFTLWMYQSKVVNDANPELGAKTAPVEQPVVVEEIVAEEVEPEPVVMVETEEPVVSVPVVDTAEIVEDVEPEPVVVTPAQPVASIPEVQPEPVVVTPDPVVEEPVKKIPTEAEILASKPSYNVSQNEKMFVADENYETDDAQEEVIQEIPEMVVNKPAVTVGGGAPVAQQQLAPAPEIYAEDFVTEEVVETCADGNLPDADGCCAGEFLADMGGGEYACCAEETGECFPPLF
ncbi:MAG: hypothetical protein IKW57_00335 [Alphaproteobacteria bacterium]|nr:hypothetical protein [Alphaproteobacteria bacterium]